MYKFEPNLFFHFAANLSEYVKCTDACIPLWFWLHEYFKNISNVLINMKKKSIRDTLTKSSKIRCWNLRFRQQFLSFAFRVWHSDIFVSQQMEKSPQEKAQIVFLNVEHKSLIAFQRMFGTVYERYLIFQ